MLSNRATKWPVHLFVISSYSLKVSAKSVCAACPVGILNLADARYQAGFACQGLLLAQATLRMRDSSMLNNAQRRTVYPYLPFKRMIFEQLTVI